MRFVIVSDFAATIRGSSYVTFNLDFCHARDRENLLRLAQVLGPYHPRLRGAPAGLPFRFDEDTLRGGLNFTLATDVGDIDLVGEVAVVGDCAAALAASEQVGLFGATFDVLTLDALIASKRAAGRPKDLLVLPSSKPCAKPRKNKSVSPSCRGSRECAC